MNGTSFRIPSVPRLPEANREREGLVYRYQGIAYICTQVSDTEWVWLGMVAVNAPYGSGEYGSGMYGG